MKIYDCLKAVLWDHSLLFLLRDRVSIKRDLLESEGFGTNVVANCFSLTPPDSNILYGRVLHYFDANSNFAVRLV